MAKESNDDNDLVIFLGAGASKPIGIPDMYEFVEEFESKIEEDKGKVDLLAKVINNEKIDLEELLRRLHRMSNLLEDETYLRMLNPAKYKKEVLSSVKEVEEELMDFVYEKCSSFDEDGARKIFRKLIKLKDLLLCDCLKIFTTNYDICTESSYEKQNLAFATGFKMKGTHSVWDRTVFRDPSYKIHIYKLHGSITWYKYNDQIVQLPSFGRELSTPQGEKFKVKMIYPLTGKEVFETPYSELQYYLQKTLESCSICIVIGYSFRDDSINNIFANAFNENEDLKVVIIDPKVEEISKKFDHEVIKIQKKIENVDLKENELIKIGASHLGSKVKELRDSKEYEKGIRVGKRAMELALNINDFEDAAFACDWMSDCFMYLEDEKNKIKYDKKAIELHEKVSQKSAKAYENIGMSYKRLGYKENAIKNYKEAEKLYEEEGNTEKIEEMQRLIASLAK